MAPARGAASSASGFRLMGVLGLAVLGGLAIFAEWRMSEAGNEVENVAQKVDSLGAALDDQRQQLQQLQTQVAELKRQRSQAVAPAAPAEPAAPDVERKPRRFHERPSEGSGSGAAGAAVGGMVPQAARHTFDQSALVDAGLQVSERLRTCCHDGKRRGDSVAWLEAAAFLSACVLTDVEVIIESGVASGFSSEVWARFFEGTNVRIYAIDKDSEGQNDTPGASRRLDKYPNVIFIPGDSVVEVPLILERHVGQRIGIFVDGPKQAFGMHLTAKWLNMSKDVKFASMHDVIDEALMEEKLIKARKDWARVVLGSWQPIWRQPFSNLDGCQATGNCGWGMMIVRGQDYVPWTAADDEYMKTTR